MLVPLMNATLMDGRDSRLPFPLVKSGGWRPTLGPEPHASASPTPADRANIPQHVAIIMDGNGRWAKQRGLPRIEGHRRGVEAVRTATYAARDLGVRMLTLYAFSAENWNRPKDEVGALMGLLELYLKKELETFVRDKVSLRTIGRIDGPARGRPEAPRRHDREDEGSSPTTRSSWRSTTAPGRRSSTRPAPTPPRSPPGRENLNDTSWGRSRSTSTPRACRTRTS
jgi:hypothetical protein